MTRRSIHILVSAMCLVAWTHSVAQGQTYKIVGTGQTKCYDASKEIPQPPAGQPFYGQDAQYRGSNPSYAISKDGLTVYDNTTGLNWQRSPDTNGDGALTRSDKLTWAQAQARPAALNAAKYGGFTDWRVPTIKELYSLMNFSGTDPSGFTGTDTRGLTPFIDTVYFKFAYGETSSGERIIDSQYGSSTMYVNKTWQGFEKLFGLNLADGRIKGYDLTMPGNLEKTFFIQCVRGNLNYGKNDFVSNGDGTITDRATGLMWSRNDSESKMNWQEALAWVQLKNSQNYLGHNDWRLPHAKELQSIVDYSRSPDNSNSPAIDSMFTCTRITNEAGQPDYPCYWTSTTHAAFNGMGAAAVYVAFGRAMGYMGGAWQDVHGAGCQRSDPKSGDPAEFPYGRGPQGDAIRIYNYVRVVRDVQAATGVEKDHSSRSVTPGQFELSQNYPNPFNPTTAVSYQLTAVSFVSLKVFDVLGREVADLVHETVQRGAHEVRWNASGLPSGIYYCRLTAGSEVATGTMTLLK